jgi:dihydrodipicolinate synthase/N-acetylneuraminate lyase
MNPIVGSIVALVTPMHQDGRVDYEGLRRLIDCMSNRTTNSFHESIPQPVF